MPIRYSASLLLWWSVIGTRRLRPDAISITGPATGIPLGIHDAKRHRPELPAPILIGVRRRPAVRDGVIARRAATASSRGTPTRVIVRHADPCVIARHADPGVSISRVGSQRRSPTGRYRGAFARARRSATPTTIGNLASRRRARLRIAPCRSCGADDLCAISVSTSGGRSPASEVCTNEQLRGVPARGPQMRSRNSDVRPADRRRGPASWPSRTRRSAGSERCAKEVSACQSRRCEGGQSRRTDVGRDPP